MNDSVMAVIAVLMALALFIPAALFASGRWRSGDEQPTSDEVSQPEPATVTVEQTWTQRITNVALTWVQQGIPGSRRPEAITARPPSDGGRDDDGDIPDRDVEDIEVVRPADPRPAASQVGRFVRRVLPWRRRADTPPSPRAIPLPPVATPARLLADDVDAVPFGPAQVDVHVERQQPDLPALEAVDDRPIVAGEPLTIDPVPVDLEGVDMSQAPLVPSGRGSAARLPTVGQLRGAMATGGFNRLMAWLRAFRKASNNTLAQANAMHADALAIARRTRNAYMLALQAFQAVQSDQLDRQTIYRTWQMLERTQAQAAAAAQVTRWTAQLVVASGGQQPAVAAAVATLQRNHGRTAAAIQASPVEPVQNVNWYRN